MSASALQGRYDVLIAGARCAGAATAMLLAREGLRVLVVDPAPPDRDALSTHALMRGGVMQLHRWGLLDELRNTGTPTIRRTTFHYGAESHSVAIRPRDGVDGLHAPRRTVLDPLLVDAAVAEGAEVAHGWALVDLLKDPKGRVRGGLIAGSDRRVNRVEADLVIGADGLHSRVARLVGAGPTHTVNHASAAIYGYWPGLGNDGFHWHYGRGVAVGTIPTNDGLTCVFTSVSRRRFFEQRHRGLESLHTRIVREAAPELAEVLADQPRAGKLRAFAGAHGFLRRSVGPGWALVGDAGYFKDPLTAHGITDALRDAELLVRAAMRGGPDGLSAYERERNVLARGLLRVTDRIASFRWDLEEVKDLHLELSREMKAETEVIRAWGPLSASAPRESDTGQHGLSRLPISAA